ncbi:ComF family protein [Pseudozobellia thermophila]|uniref:Phosphoribosyl transferase domain-containing protein n=1 Tax=Pseudozobellia thermophila TaxID=192903 RepID=A0A1M6ASF2_9FLAO|nr:phosphoribosyltransferase family protein [Pseudozobellia thermophila]SHI39405.1 Phosphoribosyl transferase domain-containing protein [Pseudozobellia thermophila]
MPLTDYSFNVENPVDRIFYGRINIEKASSFLFFNKGGIVQQLIHYLKYRNQQQIGTFLGDWYGQLLKQRGELKRTIDLVAPVPLHPKKLKKRGYNQVSGFAQRLAHHLGADYNEYLLIKTANTKTQTQKDRLGRWQSGKSLYVPADVALLKNKRVLLVDDVITTGGTMETCASALAQGENTSIYIASMAVVAKLWN